MALTGRRNNVLDQTVYNTVEHVLNRLTTQGAKLWNTLKKELKAAVSLRDF